MKIATAIPAALVTMSAVVGVMPSGAHGTSPTPSLFLAQATPQTEPHDASRDQAIRQNEGRFEEWGRKIDAFNAKAAERTTEARQKTKQELDKAWTDVKDGWGKLKNASRDGWRDAKDALEQNWRKLERAWNDAQS